MTGEEKLSADTGAGRKNARPYADFENIVLTTAKLGRREMYFHPPQIP